MLGFIWTAGRRADGVGRALGGVALTSLVAAGLLTYQTRDLDGVHRRCHIFDLKNFVGLSLLLTRGCALLRAVVVIALARFFTLLSEAVPLIAEGGFQMLSGQQLHILSPAPHAVIDLQGVGLYKIPNCLKGYHLI